jgi:hypothetical protein
MGENPYKGKTASVPPALVCDASVANGAKQSHQKFLMILAGEITSPGRAPFLAMTNRN